MDQRAKGGTPPTASTTKPSTPPAPRGPSSEEPRRDRARDKKRSRDKEVVENGEEEGKEMEDERRGAGRGGPGGDKGTVLELLIEGRCGDAGPRPLLYPGPADGPEGNVRLRIGLQAKRTKKPPKMLESYVCKPTFRTYQRQGRAEAARAGGGEGEVGQQGVTSPALGEAAREQGSALDAVQPHTKQTASAAPSPPSSSSRSQRPPLSATAPPVSAPASPGARTDREVG